MFLHLFLIFLIVSMLNKGVNVGSSFRNALFLICCHMMVGMLIFSYLFEWSPEDSLYFVATTISTIGILTDR